MNKVKRILIIVLILACIAVGSFAEVALISADQVSYNNTTVEAALQDLYSMATDVQSFDSIWYKITSGERSIFNNRNVMEKCWG